MVSSGRKWLVLAAYCGVAAMCQMLWLNLAPLTSVLRASYRVGEMEVSLLLLSFPLLYILLSVHAGTVIDRRGARYAILAGSVASALFSMLRIEGHNYALLAAGQLGIACGQPYIINAISKLVAQWFPSDQSSLATGVGTAGMLIGMALGMGLTPELEQAYGLETTMAIFSVISLALTLTFWLAVPALNDARLACGVGSVGLASMTALFKVRGFGLLCAAWFLAYGCFNGLMTWLELLLKQRGIGAVDAGLAGACLIGGGIVGALALPTLFERASRRRHGLFLSCLAALTCLWPLCTTSDAATVFWLAGLMGFLFLPGYPLILAESESLAGAERAGVTTGLLMLVGNAGAATLIVLMPLLNSSESDWRNALYLMLATMAGALAALSAGKAIGTVAPDGPSSAEQVRQRAGGG